MQPTIPVDLLEQFNRDNVLLFVGEGVNQASLPSSAELAEELAKRCDYPPQEPMTLPRVAGYYEMSYNDRQGLVQFLRDRLDVPGLEPPRAHHLIARLGAKTIVTTCYDRLLEPALRRANIPYVGVVANEDVAFAEERKTTLVWIWGVLDQPDSLIVTEDDHRTFLEARGNLSDVLRGELARCTWLFLGFDLEDEWFRDFYDTVQRGLDRYGRRAYVFGATPGEYTRLWWKKRNVSILETSVTQFLETLIHQLATADQRPGRWSDARGELPSVPIPISPYKGLDHYGEQDRSLFFGRDQEIERLAALIHAHRLVLVYGASGTGKTSLLQAGVIPRIKYGDPSYAVISVRALEDVRISIRNAVARQLEDTVFSPGDTLVETMATATDQLGPTVLVLDQFEEFFVHVDSETRQEIIEELTILYQAQDVPVKVVFSLREDHLARMGELEAHVAEIYRVRFQLHSLTLDQARQTIVRPVEGMGKRYEPALVDRLLADLASEGVMPPQLQLVCSALYNQLTSEETLISLDMYTRLGGSAGILQAYLSDELKLLHGPERTLARRVLKELIDAQGNRQVCTEEELCKAIGVAPAQLSPVLDKLVRSHLVRPLDLELRGETGYELAHEYLALEIAQWFDPREAERKRVYQLLQQDTERWKQFGTPVPEPTLELVAGHWEEMILGPDERLLILGSAIRQGWDIEQWVTRLGQEPGSTDLMLELLRAPEEEARHSAAQGWRYLPADPAGNEALAERALNDPAHAVRAEAAISLAHRVPQRAADLVLEHTGAHRVRRVEALARIWDETASIGQLPIDLRLRVMLALARMRLARSESTLLYFGIIGVLGGNIAGLIFGLVAGPLHWLAARPELEAAGYTIFAVTAVWLIVGPWATGVCSMLVIVSSIIPLTVFKRPKRWMVLIGGALPVGILLSIMVGIVYFLGFQSGTWWQAWLSGLLFGGVLGSSVAALFYRRHVHGSMPSLLSSGLLGAASGLVNGIIISSLPPRFGIFGYVLAGSIAGSSLLIGSISLEVGGADKLMRDLTSQTKGGNPDE